MLLIGSHALILRGVDPGRKPRDIDVIATFSELGELTRLLRQQTRVNSVPMSQSKTVLHCDDGRIVEVEIAWSDTPARQLLDAGCVWAPIPSVFGFGVPDDVRLAPQVATLDQLLTLKLSHRYLKDSPHFRKTRDDILLLRAAGAKVFDHDWLKRREKETYWYKHPKLNVMKGDFFKGDGVQYVYDHDDIHKVVAHYCVGFDPWGWTSQYELFKAGHLRPAYTLYMKEGEEVACDRQKFDTLPEHIRLWGVLEEAQVLALERSQIPFRGKVEPRRSFDIALQKVCTSITSGWFREFAWENFDRVEAMYEPDYVDRFWKAVDDGKVRKL
jgi:hypothetical protein